MPVWMALRAQMVGKDSGYALEKRRLSLARASMFGVFIHSLPYAPTWSFLRLSMITSTTLVPPPSGLPGRFGRRSVTLHPAPRRDAPSAPAPVRARNSLRDSVRALRLLTTTGGYTVYQSVSTKVERHASTGLARGGSGQVRRGLRRSRALPHLHDRSCPTPTGQNPARSRIMGLDGRRAGYGRATEEGCGWRRGSFDSRVPLTRSSRTSSWLTGPATRPLGRQTWASSTRCTSRASAGTTVSSPRSGCCRGRARRLSRAAGARWLRR